jgi:hypothetical protein
MKIRLHELEVNVYNAFVTIGIKVGATLYQQCLTISEVANLSDILRCVAHGQSIETTQQMAKLLGLIEEDKG